MYWRLIRKTLRLSTGLTMAMIVLIAVYKRQSQNIVNLSLQRDSEFRRPGHRNERPQDSDSFTQNAFHAKRPTLHQVSEELVEEPVSPNVTTAIKKRDLKKPKKARLRRNWREKLNLVNVTSWNFTDHINLNSFDWFLGKLQPRNYQIVPNIVHFTWVDCPDFQFYHLIGLLGVYRKMQPMRMLFHTDCDPEPTGEWWDEAKMIPILEVVNHETPKTIFGKTILMGNHKSDILRLEVLTQYGGIYLDLDIWVFKSTDHLRYYDYTTNRAGPARLSAGIIFTAKDSKFLRLFHESYRDFDMECYACTPIYGQNELAFKNQELLHVELFKFCKKMDGFQVYDDLYVNPMDWSLPRYAIHFDHWGVTRNQQEFPNPENIKTMDNAAGEVARYIYYGSRRKLTPDSSIPPWYKQSQDIYN